MSDLDDIERMDREGLGDLWRRLMGTAVPANMSRGVQRQILAFEVQARAHGGVPTSLTTRLRRLAAGEVRPMTLALRPGGRLLREWNGTTHVVDVVEGGFLWDGRRHRSLSAIARAITGTRWSGPRFFGLGSAADQGEATSRARGAKSRQGPGPAAGPGRPRAVAPEPRRPHRRSAP